MTRTRAVLAAASLLLTLAAAPGRAAAPPPALTYDGATQQIQALGSTIVLSWNDLGMHCMNQNHLNLSVLPPFNNLYAQVIQRGDATRLPQVLTNGVSVEYSVPGNTYSVGKTDFWTYAPALFGVTLPPNVGLTGKGLTGSLDLSGTAFFARGIPVTPWPDNDLVNEHPFQQALVIARDGGGAELARSTPVIPVSTEIRCVSSGCHASESAILNGHPREAGFDPNVRPILCGKCHATPALGTTGIAEAGYFSFRIHDQHKFLDQQMSGTAACYMCHPGNQSQCLRGAMSMLHGQQCQNCHGNMANVSRTIENGRVPWVQEPRCADCHTSAYAENANTLFRNSFGHGGVMCEGCHNSTHADVPARDPEDNANSIALQGYAGSLRDCRVCHGVLPTGAGPHGLTMTLGVEQELIAGARPLRAFPNPMRAACAVEIPANSADNGRLFVYDAQGRIVRALQPAVARAGLLRAAWDGNDSHGARVHAGVYLVRWQQGANKAATRITVVD